MRSLIDTELNGQKIKEVIGLSYGTYRQIGTRWR
jgi:hypothetical protein